jgi:predicted acylesterase/phospholipase RssA
MYNKLVLSGGGAKGIAYCGVFKYLDEHAMIDYIKQICGVSIGSIFGLLLILGYTADDISEEILNKRFSELKNIKLSHLFTKYGIDSGKQISQWLETLMIVKGYSKDTTFKELYRKTGIHFQVCASNINRCTMTIFDYITTPNVKVTKAIRMSIGIPLLFTAQRFNGDIHVDGGIINNYPIQMFNDCLDTVLGVRLMSSSDEYKKIDGLDKYIYTVFSCFMRQRDALIVEDVRYNPRTIKVVVNESTINFDIDIDTIQNLINIGYNSASDFFQNLK